MVEAKAKPPGRAGRQSVLVGAVEAVEGGLAEDWAVVVLVLEVVWDLEAGWGLVAQAGWGSVMGVGLGLVVGGVAVAAGAGVVWGALEAGPAMELVGHMHKSA